MSIPVVSTREFLSHKYLPFHWFDHLDSATVAVGHELLFLGCGDT